MNMSLRYFSQAFSQSNGAILLALATLCATSVNFASSGSPTGLGYSLQLYNAINSFRARHTVPALRWNRTLSDAADSIAKQILTTDSFDIEDSDDGVNVFINPGTTRPTASFVAESWYNESTLYDYTNPIYNSLYRNFAQMIWKSSSSVGVASFTDTENNYTTIIAKFYPVGNLKGKFRQNVIAIYRKL